MPFTQLQQELGQLGVQVTPEQQRLLQLSEQMARNFSERLLSGQLPTPQTPMGRQFQLQMMQQALQRDPDTFLPAATSQFQQLFPSDRRVTSGTRQQALQFATMLGGLMGDPASAMAMVPQAWGFPTMEGTMREIAAMNQMLSPFGGVLGPAGVAVDPGQAMQISLFGSLIQALVDALREIGGATGQ